MDELESELSIRRDAEVLMLVADEAKSLCVTYRPGDNTSGQVVDASTPLPRSRFQSKTQGVKYKRPLYDCPLCPRKLTTKDMCQHLKKAHTNGQDKCPFPECPYVGNRLWTHVRDNHTDYTRNKCNLCNVTFPTKEQLMSHVNKNHPAAKFPHACNDCGIRFATKQQLGQHTRSIHTREELFRCITCNIGYCNQSGLLTHRRSNWHRINEEEFKRQAGEDWDKEDKDVVFRNLALPSAEDVDAEITECPLAE